MSLVRNPYEGGVGKINCCGQTFKSVVFKIFAKLKWEGIAYIGKINGRA